MQASRKVVVVTYSVSEAYAVAVLVSMKANAECARNKRGVLLWLKMMDGAVFPEILARGRRRDSVASLT